MSGPLPYDTHRLREIAGEIIVNVLKTGDVVVNGQVATSVPTPTGQVNLPVTVKQGDWVTVELYGPWPEFATTNAWYVR